MNTQTVADYLLTRLSQAGVISVFGVPGDYNFGIQDAIAAKPGMAWQGMATEQGAGYAADSYARLRGLGAMVTTFGVGELSAINAIAGAYAESVPVVHIVGTPALAAVFSRLRACPANAASTPGSAAAVSPAWGSRPRGAGTGAPATSAGMAM